MVVALTRCVNCLCWPLRIFSMHWSVQLYAQLYAWFWTCYPYFFFSFYSMGSLPIGVHHISHKLVPLGSICRHSVQGASIFLVSIFLSIYFWVFLLFLPSVLPKRTCFSSLSSLILHMWPKKFNFLWWIILWTIMIFAPVLFIISLFLIFCCHFNIYILLRHFISKAQSQFMSAFFCVQVSAAYIKTLITHVDVLCGLCDGYVMWIMFMYIY